MISLPHLLPFPPAPTVLYRVLQCTSGIEQHPSKVLEFARRKIVDLWDHGAPVFNAPLALVDVGGRCIWLFAVVQETERCVIGNFLHDGLEEIQQGSYALEELYPCFASCTSPSKPCEDCLLASTGRCTSSLATLLPRHDFRTVHAKFLNALRDHILDRILLVLALEDKDRLYQKHSAGFLCHPSSKSAEWSAGLAQEHVPKHVSSYHVHLHLVDGGIIVQISPRLCSFLPFLPSIAPGTPVVLLPALVPAYYMTGLRGDSRAYRELWRTLKGHGFVAGDAEELIMCWCPSRKPTDQALTPEQGAPCIWPRSLCVVSTSRDPIIDMPFSGFVTQPTDTTNANVILASLSSHPELPPLAPMARDLGHAAERASSYIGACMRDRERVRDLQKAAEQPVLSSPNPQHPSDFHSSNHLTPSTSTPTLNQHQLYPSPPGSYFDTSLQLSGTKSDPDAPQSGEVWPVAATHKLVLAMSSELYSLRRATALSPTADQPPSIDVARRTGGEKEEDIVLQQSRWQSSLDRTTGDLDDLTLITDDVFDFFDSPRSAVTGAGEANPPTLALEDSGAANLGEKMLPDLPPLICASSLVGIAGQMTPEELYPGRGNADFGALVYPAHVTSLADPVLLRGVPKSDMVNSRCTLQSRYARMTDPRIALAAHLRTLKPSATKLLSSAPYLCQITLDNSGDDDPESGLSRGLAFSLNDDEGRSDHCKPLPMGATAHPGLGDMIPFALLTLPRIISTWPSLFFPENVDLTLNAAGETPTLDGSTAMSTLFVLSIPTPVSPEAVIADEHETLARALLPSFALEAIEGGVWPRSLLKHPVNDSEVYVDSILPTLKGALGSTVGLMAVSRASDSPQKGSMRTLLESLELPLFSLVQNNEVAHVNPSALRFWGDLGLAPLRGAKDVNAFALFQPGDGCSSAALQIWLQRVTHSYEGRRLGAHITGGCNSESGGIVSARWSNIRHILDVIDSSCENKSATPVLYLVIPSDLAIAHSSDYSYIVEALKDFRHLVHQFVPIDMVHQISGADDEMDAFVTSTYDRCKSHLERNLHRNQFEPLGRDGWWIDSPALTVAPSTLPQFRYSLNWETRGTAAADRHALLHAGYGFSSSRKWLFAACIDQRGERRRLSCWDLDELGCSSEQDDKVVLTLWNFIETFTQCLSVEWVTTICKLGRLGFAEIKAWDLCISKSSSHGKGLQHVTIMEASESAPFLSLPPLPSSERAIGEEHYLFSEASPAYAVLSNLRLRLPATEGGILVERDDWPHGMEPEDIDSETTLPLHTSFFMYRMSATSGTPPSSSDTDWGALQVNTLLSWTSEFSTSNTWRRPMLDIQRDWMSSFNDLAALAREQLRDSSQHWWPYHLLAIKIMSLAAHLLEGGLLPESSKHRQQNAMK